MALIYNEFVIFFVASDFKSDTETVKSRK